MIQRRRDRGDTIVEVLFAVAIFSLVAVSSMAIMNQGTGSAQRALEITQARQQIDAQATMLRYIQQEQAANATSGGNPLWRSIVADRTVASAENFDSMTDNNGRCQASIPSRAFVLSASSTGVAIRDRTTIRSMNSNAPDLSPYARVVYDGDMFKSADGIWIQAVRQETSGDRPNFVDFHIRACWDSPGSSQPVTLGTIVRLYEPRG